jgi:hypothetical protein
MSEAITRLDELTPVAQFVDCGKVTAREFISRDGHRFVGYRATPETTGFLVWERWGDFLHGFVDGAVYRCSTEAEARAWVLRGSMPQAMGRKRCAIARLLHSALCWHKHCIREGDRGTEGENHDTHALDHVDARQQRTNRTS